MGYPLPDFFLRKPKFSPPWGVKPWNLGWDFFSKDDYEKRIVGWWEYPGSKFEIRLEPWGALIFQEDTVKVDPWQLFGNRDLLSTCRLGIPPKKKVYSEK